MVFAGSLNFDLRSLLGRMIIDILESPLFLVGIFDGVDSVCLKVSVALGLF